MEFEILSNGLLIRSARSGPEGIRQGAKEERSGRGVETSVHIYGLFELDVFAIHRGLPLDLFVLSVL
jgi:hypothetical protein